jgi:hypothetical protein
VQAIESGPLCSIYHLAPPLRRSRSFQGVPMIRLYRRLKLFCLMTRLDIPPTLFPSTALNATSNGNWCWDAFDASRSCRRHRMNASPVLQSNLVSDEKTRMQSQNSCCDAGLCEPYPVYVESQKLSLKLCGRSMHGNMVRSTPRSAADVWFPTSHPLQL